MRQTLIVVLAVIALLIPPRVNADSGKNAIALGVLTASGMAASLAALYTGTPSSQRRCYDYTEDGDCGMAISYGQLSIMSVGSGMFVGSLYYLLTPESKGNHNQALLTLGKGQRWWKVPAVTWKQGLWRVPLVKWRLPLSSPKQMDPTAPT